MNKNSTSWPHLMVSGFGSPKKHMDDYNKIYSFLKSLPKKVGMELMGLPIVYRVDKDIHPDIGITGVSIITTSHISIHTFPNGQKDGKRKPRGLNKKTFGSFFCFDLFSCNDFDPEVVIKEIKKVFKPKQIETAFVYRLREDANLIEVEDDI